MNIQTQRLRIRDAGAQDAELLCRWWNDGAVMAHAGFPDGVGTTPEKIAEDLVSDTDLTRRRLIIELDGYPIGEMNYHNLGDGVGEIGIKICEADRQEKGFGKIVLSLLIRTMFGDLGYHTIRLDTNLANLRAQHVYESLGFQKQRVHENFFKNTRGEWMSAVDYELKPEQFVDFAKE